MCWPFFYGYFLGMKLEICCVSVQDAEAALTAGADRIELCEDLSVGGLTPEESSIREIVKLGLPVMVLIRPHARGFVYTVNEQLQMLRSSEKALSAGAHGLVVGALTKQQEINGDFMATVRKEFPNTPLTFHKAIDETRDIDRSFNYLVSLGFKRALSSGGKEKIIDGVQQITHLQSEYGRDIILLAGGQLRSSNLDEIVAAGIQEFHTSARTARTSYEYADEEEIQKIHAILHQAHIE